MSALPDNRKIKPQQRLFFLLILLFGLPAHFLPLIRFFCFKHFHSFFHFSLLLITYFGALAQLGAHNTGSVGVRGSNPLCSTILKPLGIAEKLSASKGFQLFSLFVVCFIFHFILHFLPRNVIRYNIFRKIKKEQKGRHAHKTLVE